MSFINSLSVYSYSLIWLVIYITTIGSCVYSISGIVKHAIWNHYIRKYGSLCEGKIIGWKDCEGVDYVCSDLDESIYRGTRIYFTSLVVEVILCDGCKSIIDVPTYDDHVSKKYPIGRIIKFKKLGSKILLLSKGLN